MIRHSLRSLAEIYEGMSLVYKAEAITICESVVVLHEGRTFYPIEWW